MENSQVKMMGCVNYIQLSRNLYNPTSRLLYMQYLRQEINGASKNIHRNGFKQLLSMGFLYLLICDVGWFLGLLQFWLTVLDLLFTTVTPVQTHCCMPWPTHCPFYLDERKKTICGLLNAQQLVAHGTHLRLEWLALQLQLCKSPITLEINYYSVLYMKYLYIKYPLRQMVVHLQASIIHVHVN